MATGWNGVWLDRRPPWKQIAELLEDGYRLIASRTLVAQLDGLPVPLRMTRVRSSGEHRELHDTERNSH